MNGRCFWGAKIKKKIEKNEDEEGVTNRRIGPGLISSGELLSNLKFCTLSKSYKELLVLPRSGHRLSVGARFDDINEAGDEK